MILNNLILNSVGKSPSEKLTGLELVKKVPALYGNGMFITAFKGENHLSLF
jgi:hypothetical protein